MVLPQSSDIEQQWGQVRGLLRAEVGDTAYSTWLKPLDLAHVDGDRVVIAVPTQFMRDWVVGPLCRPHPRPVDLDQPERPDHRPERAPGHAGSRVAERLPAAPAVLRAPEVEPLPANETAALEDLGARLDPRFTFETFVVGKPNEFAVAAAERRRRPRPSRRSTRCSSMAASGSARPT